MALQADMNTRLHVLNQPKLSEGSEQPENIMLHLVKLGRWGIEIGSEEYITGTLPMAPDAGSEGASLRVVSKVSSSSLIEIRRIRRNA